MMLGASAALLLKLWYIDRMVYYYEQHRDAAGGERFGRRAVSLLADEEALVEGEDGQEA